MTSSEIILYGVAIGLLVSFLRWVWRELRSSLAMRRSLRESEARRKAEATRNPYADGG